MSKRLSEIDILIQDGVLEQSSATIVCPNCESEVSLFDHRYDSALNAFSCSSCRFSDWANDVPSEQNARRCQSCEDYVTDDDVDAGRSIQCVHLDAREFACEQLAHPKCVDFCKDCGWICESHESDYERCDSCGLLHHHDHFVSGGKEFVEVFGDICWNCFHSPIEDEAMEEQQKEELQVKAKAQITDVLAATVERKREDSSKYLSHLIRVGQEYDERRCFERLVKILTENRLIASDTGYFSIYNKMPELTKSSKAVCFTEARLSSLYEHTKRYSPFGLAFSKFALMKNHRASPVIHIHGDIIESVRDNVPVALAPYINLISVDKYDFHYEREWRVPSDLGFNFNEISFVFAPAQYHAEICEIVGHSRIYCLKSLTSI